MLNLVAYLTNFSFYFVSVITFNIIRIRGVLDVITA